MKSHNFSGLVGPDCSWNAVRRRPGAQAPLDMPQPRIKPMNISTCQPNSLQLFEPQPNLLYAIATVEHLAHIPQRTILVYCKYGLVSPAADAALDGYYFDAEAIHALRRIEHLRVDRGINLAGIKIILDLSHELERLGAKAAWNMTRPS
jgi:hypothetical protein